MSKINVAIVDDNERMVTLLENILNEDSDISVVGKGGDGLQALNLIKEKEPDVVLLDLIMPKLDGLEVMQKVNQEKNLKKKTGIYRDFGDRSGKYYGGCLWTWGQLLYYETF